METVESDTDAASGSQPAHQNTCSHSTWPPLSGSGSKSFDHALETNNNSDITAVSQRRRVNPETLALRLGPDLVRDLEALIQPGNVEMPTFAVRKVLQERYNIDRRHIYDYFHSRGLRVIKEDKNGNGIEPKYLASAPSPMPMPNLRARISRQPSMKELRRASTASLISKRKEARPPPVSKPCGVMKAKPGRQRKHAVQRSTHDNPPPPAGTAYPIGQPVNEMNRNPEFDPMVSSPDEFSSFAQATDDTSDTHCGSLVFETSPTPHQSLPQAGLDLRGDAAGLGLSPRTTSADPLSPNFCKLSATERSALYPGASSTCDTQECAGTYRTYMQERSRLYYEELLAVPACERLRNDRIPASSGDHQSVPFNGSEFRRWVNPGESCVSRNKCGASTIRQKTSPVLPYDTDNEVHSLETLFPMLDQNRIGADDWESPVVRTQHQSYVPLDFCFLPNAESGDAEDHLATTSSSLGAPGFPECSASLPSKIHGESFHGHPDFPRSPPLLPPAELQQIDVNPKRFTPPLQHIHEMDAFTLKQKSSRTQTRFAPCTPPKSQLREYDRIMMRSFTSRNARRRTTSACGGI